MNTIDTVTVPRVSSVKTAVQIFYKYNELGINEIRVLFACGRSKASQLKAYANAYARRDGLIPRCNAYISTDAAFKAWGLDIHALENRLKKAEKLNIAV